MRILALLLAGAALTAPLDAAPPAWTGEYYYEQALGRDLSGTTALFVTHRLTLGPRRCLLATDGYQINERVRCAAVATPHGIEVRFRALDNRDGANARPARRYRPGEALFRLERRGESITTNWLGYGPAPEGARSGRFFRRE